MPERDYGGVTNGLRRNLSHYSHFYEHCCAGTGSTPYSIAIPHGLVRVIITSRKPFCQIGPFLSTVGCRYGNHSRYVVFSISLKGGIHLSSLHVPTENVCILGTSTTFQDSQKLLKELLFSVRLTGRLLLLKLHKELHVYISTFYEPKRS